MKYNNKCNDNIVVGISFFHRRIIALSFGASEFFILNYNLFFFALCPANRNQIDRLSGTNGAPHFEYIR